MILEGVTLLVLAMASIQDILTHKTNTIFTIILIVSGTIYHISNGTILLAATVGLAGYGLGTIIHKIASFGEGDVDMLGTLLFIFPTNPLRLLLLIYLAAMVIGTIGLVTKRLNVPFYPGYLLAVIALLLL